MFRIGSSESLNVSDSEIQDILARVYVDSGFMPPERAKLAFTPIAVRSRGHLICARPENGEVLAGMAIVVPYDSPARLIADTDETELHLLAVSEAYRSVGLGRRLVRSAIDAASALGYRKMILWTQPVMTTAQRLYESESFVRVPGRDPNMNGINYLAYLRQW